MRKISRFWGFLLARNVCVVKYRLALSVPPEMPRPVVHQAASVFADRARPLPDVVGAERALLSRERERCLLVSRRIADRQRQSVEPDLNQASIPANFPRAQ